MGVSSFLHAVWRFKSRVDPSCYMCYRDDPLASRVCSYHQEITREHYIAYTKIQGHKESPLLIDNVNPASPIFIWFVQSSNPRKTNRSSTSRLPRWLWCKQKLSKTLSLSSSSSSTVSPSSSSVDSSVSSSPRLKSHRAHSKARGRKGKKRKVARAAFSHV